MTLYSVLNRLNNAASKLESAYVARKDGFLAMDASGKTDTGTGTSNAQERRNMAISRTAVKILRHDTRCIQKDGSGASPMDESGCVRIGWLVQILNEDKTVKKACSNQDVSIQDVLNLIDTQTNPRLAYERRDSDIFVYAHQGHALNFYEGEYGGPIKFDRIWRRLEGKTTAIHNTQLEYVDSILENGLQTSLPAKFQRGRNQQQRERCVHMWDSDSAKRGRDNATAWIVVDIELAKGEGIDFYIAKNGVILATEPIPSKTRLDERPILSNVTREMLFRMEQGHSSESYLDEKQTESDDPQYVSWKDVNDSKKLELATSFFKDLERNSEHEAAKILQRVLVNPLESVSRKKIYVTFYESNEVANLYMAMVNGKDDFYLERMAAECNFPRGLPIIWKPGSFIDIRGFYPKFKNDTRNNNVFDTNMLNGATEIKFFLKWSGFLLHILAFRHDDQLYWTVCTKKVAYNSNSPFINFGKELAAPYMTRELADELASGKIYIGAEALHTDDVHGYIVKSNTFVVTCVGMGSYIDIKNPDNNIQRSTLVEYNDITHVIDFCTRYDLPCDTGYIIKGPEEDLKLFATYLFANRDEMKCSDFRTRIDDYSSTRETKLKIEKYDGSKKHEEVVGENLEGFVLNISGNTVKRTYKVKLPFYTWRTFFLRAFLTSVFPSVSSGSNRLQTIYTDEEFSYSPAFIPAVKLISSVSVALIRDFIDKWCCTVRGKLKFESMCKAGIVALKTQLDKIVETQQYPDIYFSAKVFRERLHVLVADYVESMQEDEITRLVHQFHSDALHDGVVIRDTRPTVFICVGPIGYGKSTSTRVLAEKCRNVRVEIIDCDLIAQNLETTLSLGDERNDATLGAVWLAIMKGHIPLISTGGGQFISREGANIVCRLKSTAMEIFGCEINLIAAVMQNSPESGTIKEINPSEADGILDDIYKVDESFTFKIIEDRIRRKEYNNLVDKGKMHKLSTGNLNIAKAIFAEATKQFIIPCNCNSDDALGFIEHSVTQWELITQCFTSPVGIPGKFLQLRAIVFTAKKEAKHITIAHEPSLFSLEYAQFEKIDRQLSELKMIAGKQCKMILYKDSDASATETGDVTCDPSADLSTAPDNVVGGGYAIQPFEERNMPDFLRPTGHDDNSISMNIDLWSEQEIADFRLTQSMFAPPPSAKFTEERCILERKLKLYDYVKEIQAKERDAAIISVVYIPELNHICNQYNPRRLAHVTMECTNAQPRYSQNVIQWFLASCKPGKFTIIDIVKKPGKKTDGNVEQPYTLEPPKISGKLKILTSKTVNFRKSDDDKNHTYKKGDIGEIETAIKPTCMIDDETTQFTYSLLIPVFGRSRTR